MVHLPKEQHVHPPKNMGKIVKCTNSIYSRSNSLLVSIKAVNVLYNPGTTMNMDKAYEHLGVQFRLVAIIDHYLLISYRIYCSLQLCLWSRKSANGTGRLILFRLRGLYS